MDQATTFLLYKLQSTRILGYKIKHTLLVLEITNAKYNVIYVFLFNSLQMVLKKTDITP